MTENPHDPFFQFPLCLLNVYGNEHEKVNRIVDYSIMRYGEEITAETPAADMRDEVRRMADNDRPVGLNLHDRTHLSYAVGMIRLNVCKGRMRSALENIECAKHYIDIFTSEHGRDAEVRIKTTVALDCLNGRMTWRDFSTLAALYSIIGVKPYPVQVHRSMIQARQLGFKSPSIMRAVLEQQKDLRPLTVNQIRYTLDSLENAGWFARVQASRRKVFYSHRMTRDEIKTYLLKKHQALGRARKHRTDDRAFQAELKKARGQ